MRLHRLRIVRFRGIENLEWTPSGRVTCLVGPGDTTKTTVLHAITLLGATRVAPFDDFDFHGGDPNAGPIVIEGVFAELPDELLADDRLGLDLVGLATDGTIHSEPGEHNPGAVIRLDVDNTLEPVWSVVSSRHPDGRPITARDRAAFRISRLGTEPDRQFSLARGTALARSVATTDDVARILAEAYRMAKEAVRDADLTELSTAVRRATTTAGQLAAGAVVDDLTIGLDVSPTSSSGLSLHSTGIPVRLSGLGTRRLVALGLEFGNTDATGLVCIDELEHGLEPHRIRHLIRVLRTIVAPGNGGSGGHVLFTSHSPTVVAELGNEVDVVKREGDGGIVIKRVAPDLTGLVRAAPEALLAAHVIVAEGATEVGVLRTYDRHWAVSHSGDSLAQKGVVVVDGGGSNNASTRALGLSRLGYRTLLLIDSDRKDVPIDDLASAGVVVVMWQGSMCTEQRLTTDLSWEGLEKLLELAMADGRSASSLVDAILGSQAGSEWQTEAGVARSDVGDTLASLRDAGMPQDVIRVALGQAAAHRDRGWFKRTDHGERLGELAVQDAAVGETPFGQAIAAVEAWCHGDTD